MTTLPRYIIRTIPLAHCKRGPERCAKCREMAVGKPCLLDIAPPHPSEIQRRVIEVKSGGETTWREFDIVQVFESPEEAWAYVHAHKIEDVEL